MTRLRLPRRTPRRIARGRFILLHLAAVGVAGAAGLFMAMVPLTLVVAVAPLLGMRSAVPENRRTFALSTVLALLLVAGTFAVLILHGTIAAAQETGAA